MNANCYIYIHIYHLGFLKKLFDFVMVAIYLFGQASQHVICKNPTVNPNKNLAAIYIHYFTLTIKLAMFSIDSNYLQSDNVSTYFGE